MSSSSQKELAILILAGGQSRRFGREKWSFEVNDKPLLLYQIETLEKFDEDIFLSVNSQNQIYNLKEKIKFPKEVNFIEDDRELFPYPELFTPLLGIYSGVKKLNNLDFKKVFVISGDAPLIDSDVIKYMIKQSEGFDLTIPRWENAYLESMFAIYPVKETYHKAKEILKEKEHYGLNKLIEESWKINYISVEKQLRPLDPNLFSLFNVNSPIDIEKLKELFKEKQF
ncbi:MAG: molybdenum cofactor guanylyltransferase [Promethearchaeota archaeon]|nr:MAG: molybdenum cofactor guanylyltransferase [Candidatus Lokiarchaeota archaeon]